MKRSPPGPSVIGQATQGAAVDQQQDEDGAPESDTSAAGAPPPPSAPALRRDPEDRVIAGVAAGLARYLGVDTAVIRIVFVLLAVFGGSGFLLYLIGWIAIPEGGEAAAGPRRHSTPRLILGLVLLVIGAGMLANRLVPGFGEVAAPLVLIAVGVVLLVGFNRG